MLLREEQVWFCFLPFTAQGCKRKNIYQKLTTVNKADIKTFGLGVLGEISEKVIPYRRNM